MVFFKSSQLILIADRVVNHWPKETRQCRHTGSSEWEIPQVSFALIIQSLKTSVLGKLNNVLSSEFLYLVRTQRFQNLLLM